MSGIRKTYLERAAFRLRQQEVEDKPLDGVPDDEDDVGVPIKPQQEVGCTARISSSPSNLCKRDGPRKLVEQSADGDGESGEGHTLGTHFVGQHLHRVQSLKRRQADGVEGAE